VTPYSTTTLYGMQLVDSPSNALFALCCHCTHQVQNFTHQQVTEVRNQLLAIDKELVSASLDKTSPRLQELKREVVLIGNTFLRLEKFVNMNFTGFYKVRGRLRYIIR
jgi:SPX domain protein involved in polyphosphate accumulation